MGEGLRDYQKKLVGAWDLQEDSFQNGGSRRQGIYEGKYLLLSSSILSIRKHVMRKKKPKPNI